MKRGLAVCVLALLAQLPSAAWARSVLIAHSCPAFSSPAAELGGLGFFDTITDFDAASGTPTLAQLLSFDVALVYTNCSPNDPVGLGDVLADYIDAGGRAVVATYAFTTPWGIGGRITTTGYLPLVNVGANGDVSGLFNAVVPLDPIFAFPNAITPAAVTYFHNSNFSHPGLDLGATALVDDGFGQPLAAINGAQTVVGLNLFPDGGGFGGNTEFYRFLENALARVRFICNADGTVDLGEDCDDGNTDAGDGCDPYCRVEPCYSCTGAPSGCSPLADGSACNDGLFCNGADTCSSAACTVHAGDPCTGGPECGNVCNEASNNCAVVAFTPCTDDTNVCTDDVCDGAGACVHPGNFGPCDDGLFCTGLDFCDGGGDCTFHNGDPCLFSSECNTVCDDGSDTCTPTTIGTPCSEDGFECTSDACDGAGACAHPPVAGGTPCTEDGNECTADECDGAGFCGHPAEPNGTSCDDDDACTQTDGCQAGECVGSDPIVCAAPVCHGGAICDPETGTCSSCPAGYSAGGEGCQKTYSIDAGLLNNQASFCDGLGVHRYNGCFGAFGFQWNDTGDASVGDVTRVDIQFDTGIECQGADHAVSLNATPIGVYAPTAAACTCTPGATTTRLFADVDSSTYVKGGMNAVSIDAVDCAGLSQDADGAYAVVTVTYEDPGYPLAIESSCRDALKSKLKYKNNANDEKDKLIWKWGKGDMTTQAELGNPTTSASYEVCIFGETAGDPTLLFGASVPSSSSRWSAVGTSGYKYKDSAADEDGMKGILLKGGAEDKSKIVVKGKGAALSDPTLPLAPGITGIRAQITNESNDLCWESVFPIGNVTADERGITAAAP